jgi:hypothetical protein
MRKWLWLVALLIIAGSAVGILFNRDNPKPTGSDAPSPAVGLVTKVTEETVTLVTDNNQKFTFLNRAQNISTQHLNEHMNKKEPLSITWQAVDNQNVATRIDDVQ